MKKLWSINLLILLCITISPNLYSAAQIQSESDSESAKLEETRKALLKAINDNDVESLRSLVKPGIDFKKIGPLLPWKPSSILVNVLIDSEPAVVKEMIKILIEAGADINQVSDIGSTPLSAAMLLGDEDIMKFLLDHGADVNLSAGGYTALSSAVLQRSEPMVQYLLKHGVNLFTIDEAIQTARKYNRELLGLLEKAKKEELARREAMVIKRRVATSQILEEHLPKVISNIISETATHEYADVPELERK